ncbi:Hypothetical_protein [Hexamita inflata]|uniref:Hypothetical_protein n=1 Tax=Hexamita inflata TaxID=28002 RepID=A0AA86QDL8_9EUKA|nr:Hypothetical protein HINF_LOCUS38827 [Hexamita inflata]
MTYTDYYTCSQSCYNGDCDSSYNNFSNTYEYTCNEGNGNTAYALLLLIVPLVIIFIFTLICSCNKKNRETEQRKATPNRNVVVQPEVKAQNTKVNLNVTGIAPQGQLVTLPNGQVGVFIPLTQQQTNQVRQVQVQQLQQAPQFYLPQPIYQQQVYRVQEDQTVNNIAMQMPRMPNML